jgi:hypothetical protein
LINKIACEGELNKKIMKKLVLLISIFFISLNVFALQAPKPVLDAFQQKFDGATNVKWKEGETEFEASFDLLGKRMTATFNPQGQWLATETEIGARALPALAKVVLQTRFIGWNIATAHKVEKADRTNLYQADLTRNGTVKEVFINRNGVIMK